MGIGTVAVFSDADADAPLRRRSRRSGQRSAGTVARPCRHLPAHADQDTSAGTAVTAARRRAHPGYGFLSENAGVRPRVCGGRGHLRRTVAGGDRGDGLEDRRQGADGRRRRPGAPGATVPRSTTSPCSARRSAPALVKAAFGGGGRGMRIVRDPAELIEARRRRPAARRPRRSATGRCSSSATSTTPRHVEVQIFGDPTATCVHLFERECSIQRRHQKIIEEAPSPAVDRRRCEPSWARRRSTAARALGYVGAGTVEFVSTQTARSSSSR